MIESQRYKNELKRNLFKRDGWCEGEVWKAFCAFGCGKVLEFATATLDHYPRMKCQGGKLVSTNARLACQPCNSANCNSALKAESKKQKYLADGYCHAERK